MTGDLHGKGTTVLNDRLYRWLEQILSLDDPAEIGAQLEKLLAQIARSPCVDGETLYIKGYAAYHHPDHHDDPRWQGVVESTLLEALERQPPPPIESLILMYLGHELYDRVAFKAAAGWFDRCECIHRSETDPFTARKVIHPHQIP